jgi:hypothetical protein
MEVAAGLDDLEVQYLGFFEKKDAVLGQGTNI